MPIHVALHHRSHYSYDRPVGHLPHIVRLRPAPHCRTSILSYALRILPARHFINWQQDPFSNYLARLVFPEKSTELLIEVDLVAEMAVLNPFDYFLEPCAEKFPVKYEPSVRKELAPFLEAPPATPLLDTFLNSIDRREVPTNDFLVNLNRRLAQEIKYLIRLEPGVQPAEETLALRSGSCRDTGWLLVQILRHLGLAARFVSGYLIQLKPDVKSLDGPSGTEMDFTDLHAWCEVFLPGAGWIGLDPTSGLLAGEGHIPLACTPEPSSAAPISGAVDDCEAKFTHEMRVTRIFESPRVTRPYTDDQWNEIETLGHRIDAELQRNDVRLTMGGEPTFISIDDMDGAEWNFTAVGPEKRRLSGALIRRLKSRFAPGGLLHFGQGKWYPGESLPRWALSCYWRKDGQVIWHDDSLFADQGVDYGHTEKQAAWFMHQLAHVLDVKAKHILPAYEDAWYYMWRERQLPANVDPLESRLEDKEERARLTRVFNQGLKKIVGYVLPLRRRESYWTSGPWFLRTEHLFLIPGDSPIGLRLPLDSVPWVARIDHPSVHPRDPMEQLPPLPAREELRARLQGGERVVPAFLRGAPGIPGRVPVREQRLDDRGETDETERRPAGSQSADWIVRTALCVEPRNGRLHIFMPPVRTAEDYLDLTAAVEKTAAELKLPIVLEGSAPPHDPRLNHIKVTPDPGVIEVNLHPAHDWDELVKNTTALYEEARQTRLGTEKFMIDGRHVGTGGGNHVVIGGPTPADSPILRRPDLLRSLLCYWQNHPSLSFLFSGLFIGPTSQHPRVDEARNDTLYELEIAFKELDRQLGRGSTGHWPVPPGDPPGGVALKPHGKTSSTPLGESPSRAGESPAPPFVPPWLVDRIFRNLLIDVTGNTHRAEFCIDKLYAPESSSGRLGLVELRAFEMPPHARMSLTQQLLLRSLIARFWKNPYARPLVRWGAELHDRFMLPHFVEEDFGDVIADLQDNGYQLKPEWFAPHFEFRFPYCGSVTQRGVHLELRQALEPWNVLGEQAAAGATARYVDSSLERLQVKVRGATDPRHLIACNGRALPLHPTGTEGEYVAGVRFRAWQPPECLHPTIGVHTPLVFDIVDGWNGRSIGGCTYHVAHPGGRHHATLPVNSYEAESRRLARFSRLGHTAGRMNLAPPEPDRNFPFTLDLRKA
jgi:uncharacterized protein (DUF2126 family)/transglutaminase-like putative cysteine protease